MKLNDNHIDSWQKATIIGSVWGAFEIVAGSILHNLAIPLAAGTVLSAIGVIIMVTGAKVFGGKGIFWRSALVCAALKTVSPSPVILTPMIGITLEGLLMEFGVILLGNNIIGYILGGGLALLSVLMFKLVRLVMIYGVDIITAYKSIFSIDLNIFESTSQYGYLIPILILVLVYLIIGFLAALTGVNGGNVIKNRFIEKNIKLVPPGNKYKPEVVNGYKGGVGFLLFHLVWLILFIALKGFVPKIYWISGGVIYLILCIFRYGRVRLMVKKPAFLAVILLVSLTSSFFIFYGKHTSFTINAEFFEYSYSIFLRAAVVIVTFACINIELKSKGVEQFFKTSLFRPFTRSYTNAHSILPTLLQTIKADRRKIFKPIPMIEKMFTHFTDLESKALRFKPLIITADRHAGKTTFMKELAAWLEQNDIPISGFIAEGQWDESNIRSGFSITNLQTKESFPLCDKVSTHWQQYGVYYFNPASIELGNKLLADPLPNSVVFIDEIGLFELENALWANAFQSLLDANSNQIVISVRRTFLNQVIEKWKLHDAVIVDATTDCPEKVGEMFKTDIAEKH